MNHGVAVTAHKREILEPREGWPILSSEGQKVMYLNVVQSDLAISPKEVESATGDLAARCALLLGLRDLLMGVTAMPPFCFSEILAVYGKTLAARRHVF